jgi:hypothetical protein
VEGLDMECMKMEGFVSAGYGSRNDAPNILKGVPEGRTEKRLHCW